MNKNISQITLFSIANSWIFNNGLNLIIQFFFGMFKQFFGLSFKQGRYLDFNLQIDQMNSLPFHHFPLEKGPVKYCELFCMTNQDSQ